MTEHRPPACHFDRALGQRVTREHRDDCPSRDGHLSDCPGDRGCTPCTAPHCGVCGRRHTSNDHPDTCPKCIGLVDDDLVDIRAGYTALSTEALEAGADGRLVAAAPIPGGTAAVLVGPTVRLDMLRASRTMREDHPASKKTGRPADPLPALAVLAQWEIIYRTWLDHTPARAGVTIARQSHAQYRVPVRATLGRTIDYLRDQLTYLANHLGPNTAGQPAPDWLAFVRQVRRLRSDIEHVLHDERDPEQGVECFECGDRLVRRFRSVKTCRHETEARADLRAFLARRAVAQDWLRALGSYGLYARQDELNAAAAPAAGLLHDAKLPCELCAKATGGIDDPGPSRSWECPGCRKEYDPGEYALAVKRSLLDDAGVSGSSWCTLPTAAAAAAELTGKPITAATIRTWIQRGDDIGIVCFWQADHKFGIQLVSWPDVFSRATEKRTRGRKAAS